MKKRHEQKLIILAITVFIILNMPFLFILDGEGAVLGIPKLYFSIFSIWFLSVIISYIVLKRHYE